jgi:PAS domain S-box-containing protein
MHSGQDNKEQPQSPLGETERRIIQQTVFNLESEKQLAEERYKHLFDNALVGLFRIRLSDGHLLDINHEAVRIFGYESMEEFRESLLKNSTANPFLFSPDRIVEFKKGKPHNYTINATGRDGETIWAQVSIRYVTDTDLVEGAIKDITDLIMVQEQLKNSIDAEKAAKAEAEHASLAKSQFLANVSHEIRTPLNSIIGFSEIIASADGNAEHVKHAREILAESEKLMTLINQLLDLSKIEANGIMLDKTVFLLSDFINDTLRPINMIIKEKQLDLIINIQRDVPPKIYGDPFRLRQILLNLLSNAVKFTSRGSIRLLIEKVSENDHSMELFFQVEDTGIGIPREHLARIFDNFAQGSPIIEHNYGGTGLGLPIARKLVELMGGKLSVSSTPGKGSLFGFTAAFDIYDGIRGKDIPIDTHLTEEIQGSIRNARILVCEDYVTNQQIVYHHLDQAGCDITIVDNGLKGVEEIARKNYDLVLMDLQMPVMDGLEATRQIRNLDKGKTIPIIGMTAAAFSKDRDNSLKAGMSDFITKPIRRNVLINKVKRWVLGVDHDSPIPEEEPPQPPTGNSVLRTDEFIEETGMDESQIITIFSGFLDVARTKINDIKEALRFGSDEQLVDAFHAIKGAAAGITADRIASQARFLEYAARAQDRLLVRDKLPSLEKELDDLESAINNIKGHKT